MFGNKADAVSREKIATIISADAVIDGSVTAEQAIRVDGRVKGFVHTNESVIVGAGAVIEGGVKASNVLTSGEIRGGIEAPDGRIEITDTGKVFGDIKASRLVIDENAVFQGKCTMTGKDSQKNDQEDPAGSEEPAAKAPEEKHTGSAEEKAEESAEEKAETSPEEKTEEPAAEGSGTQTEETAETPAEDNTGDPAEEKPAEQEEAVPEKPADEASGESASDEKVQEGDTENSTVQSWGHRRKKKHRG